MFLGVPLKDPIKMKTSLGEVNIPYQINPLENIPEQDSKYLAKALGLPLEAPISLGKKLLDTLVDESTHSLYQYQQADHELLQYFKVHKTDLTTLPQVKNNQVIIDEKLYWATPENVLSFTLIGELNQFNFLLKIPKDSIMEMIEFKNKATQLPDGLGAEETKLAALGVTNLEFIVSNFDVLKTLSPEEIKENFNAPIDEYIILALQIGEERLIGLIKVLKDSVKLPDDATEEQKKLFAINVQVLSEFLKMSPAQKLALKDQLVQKIKALP